MKAAPVNIVTPITESRPSDFQNPTHGAGGGGGAYVSTAGLGGVWQDVHKAADTPGSTRISAPHCAQRTTSDMATPPSGWVAAILPGRNFLIHMGRRIVHCMILPAK